MDSMVGFVAVVQDVTKRKNAERALSQSELRFRSLMEQAPFSIQIFAPDGRTLRVNRAWEELWGVTLDQVADYNVLRDPQLEAKGIAPFIARAFAGEPVEIPPVQYDPNQTIPNRTRYTDPVRWVAAVAYPLFDERGRDSRSSARPPGYHSTQESRGGARQNSTGAQRLCSKP